MATTSSTSGIDTTLIVNAYVATWTMNYITPLQSKVSTRTAEKTELNAIASLVNDLSTKLTNLSSGTAFLATSATSSNESVLTAAADNTATAATYNVVVTQLARNQKAASNQFVAAGTNINTAEGAGVRTFRISINGTNTDVTVNIGAGDSDQTILQNMASAINSSGAAVTANVVNETGTSARLVLNTTNTGVANGLTMTDLAGGSLLLNSGVINGGGALANVLQTPLDVQFSLDGMGMTRSTNSINDAITGVTLQLNSSGNSTLTVGGDVQTMTDTINNFISSYNALIDKAHTDTAYDPSTKTAGTLIAYDIARNLPSDLVNIVGFPVNGLPDAFNSLYSIGIDTDTTGKLSVVDSAKLQNALKNNLNQVIPIFNDPTAGIAKQLKTYLDSLSMGGALDTTITSVGDQITTLDDNITYQQSLLAVYQRDLQTKFAALDALLTTNQSLLGTLSGYSLMPTIGA